MGSVSPEALARLASMQRPEDTRAGGSGWTYAAAATLEAVTADLAACGIRTTEPAGYNVAASTPGRPPEPRCRVASIRQPRMTIPASVSCFTFAAYSAISTSRASLAW